MNYQYRHGWKFSDDCNFRDKIITKLYPYSDTESVVVYTNVLNGIPNTTILANRIIEEKEAPPTKRYLVSYYDSSSGIRVIYQNYATREKAEEGKRLINKPAVQPVRIIEVDI